MDSFEETMQKAKSVINTAYQKTSAAVTLQKQKIDLAGLENKLVKAYADLGKLAFEKIKDTEQEDTAMSVAVSEVKARLFDVEQLSEKIGKAQGKISCPSCGSVIASDSIYCNVCGKRLDEGENNESASADTEA